MPITLKSYASSSALAQDGVDIITFDTTGITAGLSDALALTKTKTSLNASGAAPIYACRAWVNFNGTGTVAIRASGNVSSITDNGVGNYTVNFITAMSDQNYSYAIGGGYTSTTSSEAMYRVVGTPTASAMQILTRNINDTAIDREYISVSIFR